MAAKRAIDVHNVYAWDAALHRNFLLLFILHNILFFSELLKTNDSRTF